MHLDASKRTLSAAELIKSRISTTPLEVAVGGNKDSAGFCASTLMIKI